MSRFYAYLNTAVEIIGLYRGHQPLAVFLRSFFAGNKKYGAKDRKQLSHLCYCFYRTGKMFFPHSVKNKADVEARILSGLFLCTTQDNQLLNQLKPEWHEKIHLSANEKCAIIAKELGLSELRPMHIFPWETALSEGVDYPSFCVSFLIWPDLYLRIRPGYEEAVKNKLNNAELSYRMMHDHCIAFDNSVKVGLVLEPDKETVVQDYNSQEIGKFLELLADRDQLLVWDCCAASGGKSVLATDILKNIELTVTDIRKSILINLKKRFAVAGIKKYTSAQIDLTQKPDPAQFPLFDLIICDVPCSGSGTWSRTPEQLYFWQEGKLNYYTELQNRIMDNVISFLKPDGYLLYITCSVFKAENEDRVDKLEQHHGLKLIKRSLMKGYDKKADTLFAALLKNIEN